jgi:ATP-dependent DNA helicase RecQ
VLTLLKRHAMVREHRGGVWERLVPDVTAADLSRELTDYEERRKRDRYKLEEMVRYCRTARCRTRMIMDYFGEQSTEEFACGHCDNDGPGAAAKPVESAAGGKPKRTPKVPKLAPVAVEIAAAPLAAGMEVAHGTYGEGQVMALDGERAEVDFAGHGTRTVRVEQLRPVD